MSGITKRVNTAWTRFTDYAYFWSEWTVNISPEREIEIGVGISFRGRPRGGKFKARGYTTFSTRGIGVIKARVIDGLGDCFVRIDQGDVGPIPIYSDPSLIGAAIDDIKNVFSNDN